MSTRREFLAQSGFLAFLASTIIDPAEAFAENSKTEVIASPQALAAFPMIPRMGKWIDGEVKKVLVISAEDLATTPVMKAASEKVLAFYREEITAKELEGFLRWNGILDREAPNALKSYLEKNCEELLKIVNEDDELLEELAVSVLLGRASAWRFNSSISTTKPDIGIVITPIPPSNNPELDKKINAKGLSGLPFSAFGKLPGTIAEINFFILAHECGHLKFGSLSDLQGEVAADKTGIEIFEAARKKGIVTCPDLVEYTMALRSIGSIIKPHDGSHNTNAAIGWGKNMRAPKDTEKSYLNASKYLIEEIQIDIGKNMQGLEGAYLIVYNNILQGEEPFPKAGNVRLSKDDEPIFRSIVEKLAQGEKDSKLEPLYNQLSAAVQDDIGAVRDVISMQIGGIVMEHNHPKLFESLSRLYLNGDLKQKPLAELYAWDFLTAAQKYFPDYFKVPKNITYPAPANATARAYRQNAAPSISFQALEAA